VKAALLDINILTALLWPAHEHHEAAHRWFGGRADARWATCSLTQLGFVRIVSNPAFSRDALSPVEALALLGENLVHPGHDFWADSLQVPTAVKGMEASLQGYKQLTDAYLLALAHQRKGALATFDRGLRTLAGDAFRSSLEIVPTK
jgi:toxin-antitoxin system PIN domain toxin